jgi:hypothetical protein
MVPQAFRLTTISSWKGLRRTQRPAYRQSTLCVRPGLVRDPRLSVPRIAMSLHRCCCLHRLGGQRVPEFSADDLVVDDAR